jgi:general secretion pathway protein G
MFVILILAILASIAIPRLSTTSDAAREKADIASGREVKAALDRYQIENGFYPKLKAVNGKITEESFIPAYIKKLDSTVTQQNAPEDKKGFGIVSTESNDKRIITIYLIDDEAEVEVYDKNLERILWSSKGE